MQLLYSLRLEFLLRAHGVLVDGACLNENDLHLNSSHAGEQLKQCHRAEIPPLNVAVVFKTGCGHVSWAAASLDF